MVDRRCLALSIASGYLVQFGDFVHHEQQIEQQRNYANDLDQHLEERKCFIERFCFSIVEEDDSL